MLQSTKDLPAKLLQARRRAQNKRDTAKSAARQAVGEFVRLPLAEHRLSEVREKFDLFWEAQLILDSHVDTCHAAFVDTIDAYVRSMEDVQRLHDDVQIEIDRCSSEGDICSVRSSC